MIYIYEDISPLDLGALANEIEAVLTGLQDAAITAPDEVTLSFAAAIDEPTLDGIIASHVGVPPAPDPIFLASTTLVEIPLDITETSTWQDLGGVRTSIGFFEPDMNKVIGRIIGDYRTDGLGAELRLVKGPTEILISAETPLADTASVWQEAYLLSPPGSADPQSQTYILQGRLNGATSAQLRFMSMSLMRI